MIIRMPVFSAGAATFILACALSLFAGSHTARAATSANSTSPLAMNVMPINYYTAEQPFLNIFKTSGVSQSTPSGWVTHSTTTWDTGEEAYLQLDSNGYPTTLTAASSDPHSPQLFNSVGLILERGLPNSNAGTGLPYRAGQYVVLYDGQGTLSYGFDAKLVSSSPGRDVINVATPTSGAGIDLRITSTDPNHTGNYIRNIRVVKAEEEQLLQAGNVFSPNFLSLMQRFHVLRLMQWLAIDDKGGTLTNWSNRPHQTDAGWGSAYGVPLEVGLELCNATGADCWLNVPHKANDDYITQMATLAHAMLGASQKVYVEFSNEVWNGAYAQFNYASTQGAALWPNAGVSAFTYNRDWYGMRTAQTCDIWKTVWGADASRVVCVLGAQAAQAATATSSLQCTLWTGSGHAPCSNHGISAIAIAPYFGYGQPQSSWLSASDGGLSLLFQWLDASQVTVSSWETAYKSALAPYNLPFIAYEGGQSLQGFPAYQNGSAMVNLLIAANRDPRMATEYTTALNNWKTNGGQMYVLFADIYSPGQYGAWGALESFLDTVSPLSSAPPKWQAIQNFISGNSCWWSGCAGTIGPTTGAPAVPMAPASLTVH
ncbi:MAG TPA: hypothetical protein VNF49_12120 [Candidatus Binataceae bacterium]|nr:hypothetical protein [Candidatus Binataceae bacterium]